MKIKSSVLSLSPLLSVGLWTCWRRLLAVAQFTTSSPLWLSLVAPQLVEGAFKSPSTATIPALVMLGRTSLKSSMGL